jgi:hypothetical protein
MNESPVLSGKRVVQPARVQGTSERRLNPSHERLFVALVWGAMLLGCLLVWASVYVAAGGPLP